MPNLTEHNIQHNTELLLQASQNGDFDEVKRLIPISDPRALHSEALWRGAHYGHTECVKLLIPVSDPKTLDSYALRLAAWKGHAECIQLLIPVSDPKARNSKALQMATYYGHIEAVKLLIPVSDYQKVLTILTQQSKIKDLHVLQRFVDEYEALTQKKRLNKQLGVKPPQKHKSTKRKM